MRTPLPQLTPKVQLCRASPHPFLGTETVRLLLDNSKWCSIEARWAPYNAHQILNLDSVCSQGGEFRDSVQRRTRGGSRRQGCNSRTLIRSGLSKLLWLITMRKMTSKKHELTQMCWWNWRMPMLVILYVKHLVKEYLFCFVLLLKIMNLSYSHLQTCSLIFFWTSKCKWSLNITILLQATGWPQPFVCSVWLCIRVIKGLT